MEIYEMSLGELDRGLEAGTFSLNEVFQSLVSRVEAREQVTQAFVELDIDRVRSEIDLIDRHGRATSISGIPFGVKDIFNTGDRVTSYGTSIFEGYQPVSDAAVVSRLRSAGGVVMGKTVTTEFAYFFPGKTRNPHHPDHTPGGSSQGSAAAVADFMVPFAIGSQTAASVIRPAAFCGVIGYKASVAQFPLNGALTLSYSMDSLGFFVRSPEDLCLLQNVLLGVSPRAGALKPRKIGLVRTPYWSELDSESQAAIETAGSDLAESGIEIREVEVDGREGVDLVDAHQIVMAFEVSRSRAAEVENHREKLSDQFTELVEAGRQISFQAYEQALKQRDSANQRLRTELGDYDLFLTASAPGEAPKGLRSTGDPKFSRAWNLIGGPSVTLPAGKGLTQLPLGVQLVGHFNKDDDLIAHASWIQQNIQLGTSN